MNDSIEIIIFSLFDVNNLIFFNLFKISIHYFISFNYSLFQSEEFVEIHKK